MDMPRHEKNSNKRRAALIAATPCLFVSVLVLTSFGCILRPTPPTVYAAYELFGTVETCELPARAGHASELVGSEGSKRKAMPVEIQHAQVTRRVLCVKHPVQAQSKVRIFKLSPEGDSAFLVDVVFGRRWFDSTEVVSGLDLGDRILLMDTSEWDAVKRLAIR